MRTPKVYVITLNWNRADDTIACVESLLRLDYPRFEIVICDNASREESVNALHRWGAQHGGAFSERVAAEPVSKAMGDTKSITLIHTGGNLGYAGGMNVGIRFAIARDDYDFVWVLNNDTEVAASALSELVQRVRSDERIGICGSSLVYYNDRQKVQAYGGSSYVPWRARSKAIGAFSTFASIPADPAGVESQMAYVIGASMLVSRRYIEKVGLMDESYFLYSEEHDWAQRGRPLFRLGYAPESIVYHKHGATIGTNPSGGSALSLFYLYRNKILFAARHHPALLPTVVASVLWEAFKFFLKGYPAKGWAVVRGVLASPARGPF
jgi:GT2 family glycosyltransferase